MSPPDSPPARIALRVHPAAERAIREGHPWLFDRSILSESRPGATGDIAVVFDRKDRFLAAGLYDSDGPIRVRLFIQGKGEEIGENLFARRLREALDLRSGIATEETTGYRVVHGENDRLPGLVADLYDRTLVIKLYTRSWLPHLPSLLTPIREILSPERILLLHSRRSAEGGSRDQAGASTAGGGAATGAVALLGNLPEGGVLFRESGLLFEAHPHLGHKTGFYLDQRDNRRKLGRRTSGARVLNVFSYTGAFSIYAASGGAQEVVSVDQAGPALAQAERHFALNRQHSTVAACHHRSREGDAFAIMEALGTEGERFDVVVVDPPSFASSERHRERALASYGRLATLAFPLLHPGGLLVQASCSSRVSAEDFFDRIRTSARLSEVVLEDEEHTFHPSDHPIGFPEGAYLKCLWARVVPSPRERTPERKGKKDRLRWDRPRRS